MSTLLLGGVRILQQFAEHLVGISGHSTLPSLNIGNAANDRGPGLPYLNTMDGVDRLYGNRLPHMVSMVAIEQLCICPAKVLAH